WGRHIGTHTTGGLTRSKGLLVTGEHVRVLFLHLLVVLDGLFGHPFLLQEVDELGPGVRDELANLSPMFEFIKVSTGFGRGLNSSSAVLNSCHSLTVWRIWLMAPMLPAGWRGAIDICARRAAS